MTTHRTPTRDTSDSREAPAAQADHAQELSDAQDAAEWRQLGVDVFVRKLAAATRQIALLKGAIAAQDERERRAGEICDAVAEEVIVLRQKLEAAEQQIATLTEALTSHGQHKQHCGWIPKEGPAGRYADHVNYCTCGFDAALAAIRVER